MELFLNTLSDNVIVRDRKILNGKEIDFYLPDNKFAAEFDGLFWHSNKYCETTYHLDKTEVCEKEKIDLIHIFEDEWIFKKEIVKSLIKSKLNIYDTIIDISNCQLKFIEENVVKEFLNKNHLNGYIVNLIAIGILYDNDLISIMLFDKKRGGNDFNEYELLRYCNKLNTNIVGGVKKMLNYFIELYSPKSIITFVDRRYSCAEIFKELNFKFIKNTEPNYWYFKKNKLIRHHRYNFRKEILINEGFDQTKTEFNIMKERGYLRIYDCGSIIFELNL